MEATLNKTEIKSISEKKERNYGIDLLRIVSMFMVVMVHVLGIGGVLNGTEACTSKYYIALIFETAVICAVNCCALISGYVGYGSRHRYSNIIELTFRALFYVLIITGVQFLVFPGTGTVEIKNSIFSIFTTQYWYFTAYFCAFFFFPYLDMVIDNLDKSGGKRLLVISFVLFSVIPFILNNDIFRVGSGYSPLWLMIMYIFGAYFKKFNAEKVHKPVKYLLAYILCVGITFAVLMGVNVLNTRYGLGRDPITYTSPLVVAEALFLFMYFVNLKPNAATKKIIAVLAPLTFGVYLMHTQYFSWMHLTGRFIYFSKYNTLYFAVMIPGTALVIYLICSLADYIRSIIFKVLKLKELSLKLEQIADKRFLSKL